MISKITKEGVVSLEIITNDNLYLKGKTKLTTFYTYNTRTALTTVVGHSHLFQNILSESVVVNSLCLYKLSQCYQLKIL